MKGSRDSSYRPTRPKKRKYYGKKQQSTSDDDESTSRGKSATARKLETGGNEDILVNPVHCYRIIEFLTVFGAISEFAICHVCKQNLKFLESGQRGLGFKIVAVCKCGRREINSGPFIRNSFEINRRITFVMRLLGIGRQGLNIFCGLMDMCKGISNASYETYTTNMQSIAKSLFEQLAKKAVKEEQNENIQRGRSETDLKVSGDGSWKKRGFTSLYGVTTLIGHYTGKVLDLDVKSSYCQGCTYWRNKMNTPEYLVWRETHDEECSNNHVGSAGKMEVSSIQEMFKRSEANFQVKYGNYIGDGDSKTYKAILDLNPYGDDFRVVKSECVGHVEKRMGSRLRNIKKTQKLGGKGKLTDALIKKLTKYYGLAIRRNADSVIEMKKSIMATYLHLCSTDKSPRHENCPAGADSWCKWRVSEATGKLSEFKHKPVLHPDVQKQILPIYEDLSRDDLMERCLGGHTQNANESFNSTLWRLAPKHLNCGLKTVELAAYIAVAVFNEGNNSILKM